jgi:hypothetical protein
LFGLVYLLITSQVLTPAQLNNLKYYRNEAIDILMAYFIHAILAVIVLRWIYLKYLEEEKVYRESVSKKNKL